jgi:hypothetical protein
MITPNVAREYQRFEETYCLHHHCRNDHGTLKPYYPVSTKNTTLWKLLKGWMWGSYSRGYEEFILRERSPCRPLKVNRRSCSAYPSTLKMEATCSSEKRGWISTDYTALYHRRQNFSTINMLPTEPIMPMTQSMAVARNIINIHRFHVKCFF